MKNSVFSKCFLAIAFMVLINVFCLVNVSSAKEVDNPNDGIITLSPEQVGEQYKRLKGYRIHTVVWLSEYTFGSPFAQERENSDNYDYAIHPTSKEKPEKKHYVEVETTIGGAFLGYIDLNETVYISEGSKAKAVLDQIDKQERENEPDIENLILKADQKKHKDEDDADQAEKQQFQKEIESARSIFKTYKNNIHTLTPKELKDKHSDFEGKRFHTVLTVNSVHDDYFTAKLEKDDWLDSFNCYFDWDIDLRNHLHKGDTVEIIGTIKAGLFSGDDYTSCQIINTGKDAQKTLESIVNNKKAAKDNKTKQKKTKTSNKAQVKTTEKKTDEPNEQSASEKSSFTPVERGASGDSVVEIQNQLAVLGFLTSSVDGKFGPGTEQAVKDFQQANQLEPTGIVDKETYDAIIAAEATSQKQEASFTPIKRGDNGDSVVEIQNRLASLGYLTSSVDGKFGPGTERAVMNFQKANHLGTTGRVDESTYDKLFSSNAIHYVAPVHTSSVEESSADVGAKSSEPMVWITRTGSRYHSKSNCGRTKDSWQVTLSEARAKGLTPCGNCY